MSKPTSTKKKKTPVKPKLIRPISPNTIVDLTSLLNRDVMQYDHAGKEIGDYYVDPTTRVFLEDFLRGFDSVALAISTIQNHKHDRAAEIAAMDYAVSLLEREDPNGVVNTEG